MGSSDGSYIYTESIHHPTSPRRIIFITFDELEVRCLSLWYYRYGYTPGHLNIYTVVKEREEFLQSMVNTRKQLWSQFQANVYNATQIILEFNFTENNHGGIALDDIFISPTMCADEVQFINECVEENAELQIQCPVSDVRNIVMAFDPIITMSCQTSTDQVENKLEEIFQQCKNASMCVFTPADLLDSECYSISKRLQLMFSCTAETSTVISTTNHDSAEPSTVMSTQIEDSAETSTVISTQIHNSASNPMYTIIIVSVLVIVLIALGVITVVCYRRKTAKLSQPIGTRQDETANNMTDSMDYTAINYNEMRDIDITKINENKKAKITTNRDLPGNNASAEKEENNYNKYESLSTIRISGEHIYESGCAHDNQYQSLTNQRELDEHSYESTEHALSQYQLLTNRSESDNHAYESTSLHTDELQNKK
ncbi:Hypothetical predicted protein [Mytilus galloprovincialis]|uniref:MAM domain-containing protein n=1 Tax=Mytilus galloprovincialis TaxID=29158 RepID=A0A8B6FGQ0_MYTGA|nr:Hypothetical predicted protein [Mytilus galloprovincialis]